VGAGVVAGQVVRHGLRVGFPVRDHLHEVRGEPLRYPRLLAYDKWMTTTDAELGWLAGIIDGEGTVSLSHGGNRNPHLRISIYNGSPAILDKCRAVLDGFGIAYSERWDNRAAVPNLHITIGTAGVLALYPLLRPLLVRQVARLDAAVQFMQPRYEGRARVYWTPACRAEWELLRDSFNAA
jgi:hypothetical protein